MKDFNAERGAWDGTKLRLALGLMVGWGLVGMLGGGEGAISIATFTSTPIETEQLFLRQPQVVLASNAGMENNVPDYPEDSCKILPSVNEPASVSLVISLEDTIGKTKLTIAPGSLEKSYPEVEILRKSLEKRIDPEEIKKIGLTH